MPEVPEVKYVTQLLLKHIKGKTLEDIHILKGRYINHGPPENYKTFFKNLPLKCTHVENKGKVIFIHFSNNWTIISRLGMSGFWYLNGETLSWRKDYKNIEFIFNNTLLTYSDPRSYGTLTFVNDVSQIEYEKSKLGLDIMSATTKWSNFWEKVQGLKKKDITIDDLLMDQKLLICGVGNYLKSECLYLARISPKTLVKNMTKQQWYILFHVIKKKTKVMLSALKKNNADTYLEKFKVYKKKVDPYGNKVITYKNKTGRTTFWVPEVQRGTTGGHSISPSPPSGGGHSISPSPPSG